MLQILINNLQLMSTHKERRLDSCDGSVQSGAFPVAAPLVYSHQNHIIKRQHNLSGQAVIQT